MDRNTVIKNELEQPPLNIIIKEEQPDNEIQDKQKCTDTEIQLQPVDIQIKKEPPETENEIKPQQTTNTRTEFEEFGQMELEIHENKNCRKSKYTGIHIERKTGLLTIKVSIKNEIDPETQTQEHSRLQTKATIFRENKAYTHFPIQTICEHHQNEHEDKTLINHVLRAIPDENNPSTYKTDTRNSIVFPMKQHKEYMTNKMMLNFMCNDTCQTNYQQDFKAKESSRDRCISITIENPDTDQIIARTNINIWVKAAVKEKDLWKMTRREAKGGAAQTQQYRKRETEKQIHNTKLYLSTKNKLDKLQNKLIAHIISNDIPLVVVTTKLTEKYIEEYKKDQHNKIIEKLKKRFLIQNILARNIQIQPTITRSEQIHEQTQNTKFLIEQQEQTQKMETQTTNEPQRTGPGPQILH